ncbi:hypothetical protein FPSE_09880 [Fusarium pseudograminearum CS3096]|uniref:Uncharacterized protein n=1 Tax=Fusarium pseudograminearum (strain CS3096) TaxID=1028729 RepID=K3VY29_FUSPC|nr:hypothetical protein FPSE_09880 [Fusarium pseudograminearum CS3096]EKJ69930.1 hypothetical protein FPSE_09880 [Fusarium pseudograminearum CS3096]
MPLHDVEIESIPTTLQYPSTKPITTRTPDSIPNLADSNYDYDTTTFEQYSIYPSYQRHNASRMHDTCFLSTKANKPLFSLDARLAQLSPRISDLPHQGSYLHHLSTLAKPSRMHHNPDKSEMAKSFQAIEDSLLVIGWIMHAALSLHIMMTTVQNN